jgi:multiple sugar transport system permease protein
MRKREAIWFYIIVSPWIIGFLIFTVGPILCSIYLSLTSWDLFNAPKFIGFNNYVKLFTKDPIFWKAMGNTLYFALISIPLSMAASIAIAYLLNKPLRGMTFFRTLFYVPATVPIVASSLLFKWMLAPDTGLINRFLALFGINGPSWLLDPAWVKPALILMSLWSVGAGVVLLLAGMRGIPNEFYEAAAIDGASTSQQFFEITLPMLSPVIFFNLVMGLIDALKTFSQIYIMTNTGGSPGGPNNASLMIVPYLFDNAFRFYKMGYASAIAWVLFALIMVFTVLVFRSSSVWVYYESEVRR